MNSGRSKLQSRLRADASRRLTLGRLWGILAGLVTMGGSSALLEGCGSGGDEPAGPPDDRRIRGPEGGNASISTRSTD